MRILLLSAAVFAALAVPAHARGPSAETTDEIAIRAMHNYGRCVAQRSPRAAASLLAQDFRSEEYRRDMQRFAKGHGYCARGKLSFHGLLFVGALAEALLESNWQASQLPLLLARSPNPPLQARDEREMMALCTVRTAPAAVAGLFARPVASREETEALQSLAPTLAGCLAKDRTLNANRPGLRSLLAVAAWRLAQGNAG
jgi:hypothetical protein